MSTRWLLNGFRVCRRAAETSTMIMQYESFCSIAVFKVVYFRVLLVVSGYSIFFRGVNVEHVVVF